MCVCERERERESRFFNIFENLCNLSPSNLFIAYNHR